MYHVSDIIFPFVFSMVICTFNSDVSLFLSLLVGTLQFCGKESFSREETFSFVILFLFVLFLIVI